MQCKILFISKLKSYCENNELTRFVCNGVWKMLWTYKSNKSDLPHRNVHVLLTLYTETAGSWPPSLPVTPVIQEPSARRPTWPRQEVSVMLGSTVVGDRQRVPRSTKHGGTNVPQVRGSHRDCIRMVIYQDKQFTLAIGSVCYAFFGAVHEETD